MITGIAYTINFFPIVRGQGGGAVWGDTDSFVSYAGIAGILGLAGIFFICFMFFYLLSCDILQCCAVK